MELVIVTGAGRGIGRAVALTMADRGATVLCLSRTANCRHTAETIRDKGGSAHSIEVDLSDFVSTGKVISRWLKDRSFERIGIVLAAGSLGPSGTLATTELEDWDHAWRVNVLGNLSVVRASLPTLQVNRFGRILFFAGGGAAYAYPLFPAYAITKTALVRAVENLHEDLKDAGDFKVAILAPGAVETDMLATVRSKGGFVKTTVGIEESVSFASSFLSAESCAFSGCFVHVRDEWQPLLNQAAEVTRGDLWKLRRVE
jgi:NAD(P)-dependent dehydrogenase (short-subunit alcohol dehydrogenase family)